MLRMFNYLIEVCVEEHYQTQMIIHSRVFLDVIQHV